MIVNFGSLNADLIYQVQNVPSAGQTIMAGDFSIEAGGKGANQAVAAARAGAKVTMVGAVGEDPLADIALENVILLGMDTKYIRRVNTPTGNAAIHVEQSGNNRITVYAGANDSARADDVTDALLHEANLILIQMETPVAEVEKLLYRCAKFNVFTILNLAPARPIALDALKCVDLLIVNEDEAQSLADDLNCAATAQGLSGKLGVGVLRTLGAAGAEAFWEQRFVAVPAYSVDVIDSTAAGDCFIGVQAAALDEGEGLNSAIGRASAAAAICCTRHGNQSSVPTFLETETFLASA